MSKQIIPIVFATDESYVPYCGVAISSLIRNSSYDNLYKIYVFYDQILQTSILRLENLSTEHVSVQCICIHEYILNLKVLEYNHLTVASAYRLVIPDVLPQYEKIIYLDSDLVVNTDVAELYHIDIGGNILGAVHGYYPKDSKAALYRHITHALSISKESFFNAGVLVINAPAFRKNQIKERGFCLLSERKDLYYMDQCALNILCEGRVYFLPAKWNYEWLFLLFLNEKNTEGVDARLKLIAEPAIVHYDGIEKPWNYPEQVLSDYFWFYARQTIFYEEILKQAQTREIRIGLDLYRKIYDLHQEEKLIAVYGAGNVGKRYIQTILSLGFCKVVLWVDQNFADKKGDVLPVESVNRLYTSEFDYIVIAIENRVVAEEVKQELILNGIPKEKITWIH